MITIILNNQPLLIEENSSLLTVVENTQAQDLNIYCAAALNRHFIPRSHYEKTILHESDVIDLVIPMQGG